MSFLEARYARQFSAVSRKNLADSVRFGELRSSRKESNSFWALSKVAKIFLNVSLDVSAILFSSTASFEALCLARFLLRCVTLGELVETCEVCLP